jgi:dGTPase
MGDIVQSVEVGRAMLALREFMFEHVYLGPHARAEHERARTTIRTIFDRLADRGDAPEQIVDFIAGMTDRFALTYVHELSA